MDGFLVMESQLIKVEVDENANFHCIVCKAEFLSRTERNEHLETHFVHRSCKNCSRPVIIIGDLEFELHHPTYCKQREPATPVHEDIFEADYSLDEDTDQIVIYKCEDEEAEGEEAEREEAEEEEEQEESDIEFHHKTMQNQIKVNYDDDEANRVLSILKPRKGRLARKAKQKTTKRNTGQSNETIETNSDRVKAESEDDVIKEMNVAMKKRRKQYAKLPKTLPCTMCDAMFGSERTLKIHMNQVHGIKERYICPICQREFKISGNLKQHIETHSDYKRFICNYCGKGFHLPYNLKEHMNTHTGARPYKCETCGKTFGRNTLRQAHMRTHTGEKPYKCDAENCDRAYAYQTDLKRHRRSIHGIILKTFECNICGKIFYENKFLTKHQRTHQNT
ncbi:zinc finger protein 75A-like [Sitodiplosis mosellana]|uniref:zinc finger protein 75A-like n=1 Tax=Sitodiplosis mosellana TaxID=263140 RepID=UPI002443E344|nr:zinc finger protein 75A-like [Sitodiplosis mosellana]